MPLDRFNYNRPEGYETASLAERLVDRLAALWATDPDVSFAVFCNTCPNLRRIAQSSKWVLYQCPDGSTFRATRDHTTLVQVFNMRVVA